MTDVVIETHDAQGDYQLTNNWFELAAKDNWDQILPSLRPEKVLEIGSYEGASTVYLIENLTLNNEKLELHCVDTWGGGIEHVSSDMHAVEERFKNNVKVARGAASNPFILETHKGFSDICLARLLAEGKAGYFDFIYVDGSHQAPDVLTDAVLGFKLLRVGGVMGFDDYLWAESLPGGKDLLRCPKPAVDAFINLNFRKVELMHLGNYQAYVTKTSGVIFC